ncbi:hypothetical protein N7540_003864 [Penicillium herquei]|nr:hypothetical protein N7540_003864 [Penicillium herquei]
MSLEYAHYQPTTPPAVSYEECLGSAHSRTASGSSIYSCESSPWSTMTGNSSPGTPPTRHHHGPALLPKIRPQDVVIEPVSTGPPHSAGGPLRGHQVVSKAWNAPAFAPYPSGRPSTQRNRANAVNRLPLESPLSPIVTRGPLSATIPQSSPIFTRAPLSATIPQRSPMITRGPLSATIPQSSPIVTRGPLSAIIPQCSPIVTRGPLSATIPQSAPSLASPVAITSKYRHARAASASSIDRRGPSIDIPAPNRSGYPTHQQLWNYVPQMQAQTVPTTPVTPVTPNIVVYPSQPQQQPVEMRQITPVRIPPYPLTVPTPQYCYSPVNGPQRSPVHLASPRENIHPPSTNLLSYLTSPTQAINLVRNVSVIPTRGMHDYFWWDIRNLRNWNSFSFATFDSFRGLTQLLKTEIPGTLTPPVGVPSSRLAPESEPGLVALIRELYAPRINAALAVSQGTDHLQLYAAPDIRNTGHKNHGHPHFLANYSTDTECTSAGLIRGRLVGIVKSFDRWNSGMRNEAPHRRVEYLNGLAHLQRCMREHSCRYGFIITEIELVCVRAGCDEDSNIPYFGYLEVAAPIPLKTSTPSSQAACEASALATPISSRSFSSSSHGSCSQGSSHSCQTSPGLESEFQKDTLSTPMTASLALYFLLMLAKSVPLPDQPSAHLNIGSPTALTRQNVLPEGKDKWIPEPQIGERRDAKRVRGWVWPHDAWHRREGGGRIAGTAPPKNTESRKRRRL